MLWPEMDAAFVTSVGGSGGGPAAARRPVVIRARIVDSSTDLRRSLLGEDRVGGLGPDEWLGVLVVLVDVVVDRGLEVDDRMEAARLEPASGSWLRR